MFKPVEQDGKVIGFAFETACAYFFFGTRELNRAQLPKVFPLFEFSYMKQVHGRNLVNANPPEEFEADAQVTSHTRWALVSQSADCVPILLASASRVCAIHSGWKGTAQNIVQACEQAFPDQPPLIAAIGPHILRDTFEVGLDVAESLSPAQDLRVKHGDPQKTYFDLTELIRRQIRAAFGSQIQILECLENTQTNSLFHSFRRDKERAGRQYSFVVLKG